MTRNIMILLVILLTGLWTACQQSDAGSDNAEGAAEGQDTEAPLILDEDSFLDNSVARGVSAALEKAQPYGTEVKFNYTAFEPGAMVITESGDGLREIIELASVLNANPTVNIEIQAYVDASNSGNSNPQRVARMRTLFIKSQLIDNGVPAAFIDTKDFVVESPAENRLQVKVLGE